MAKGLAEAKAGNPQPDRKSTDRRAYARFIQKVKEADLSRILKLDLHTDRFSLLLLVTSTGFKLGGYLALQIAVRYRVRLPHPQERHYHRPCLSPPARAHALICFLSLVP